MEAEHLNMVIGLYGFNLREQQVKYTYCIKCDISSKEVIVHPQQSPFFIAD